MSTIAAPQWSLREKHVPYYAGQNDYLPVFCFEGLITEFGNNYRTGFFPRGAVFESGKQMPETGFIPWVPFLSQVKFYGKVVVQSLLSIIIDFLIFYCK